MIELYPLLMTPVFDPRPWGTFDLAPVYPNQKFPEKIGEAWLTGDHCKVANGPLVGKSLSELSQQYGRELVGQAARDSSRFPLLLKFLFPHEKLSVQVHPDDELLNWVDIHAGEMIYVAGGTVHTLGPGSILVETQQQSDTTYRLYDYGRPRELHLKEGMAAVKERVASGKVVLPAPTMLNGH